MYWNTLAKRNFCQVYCTRGLFLLANGFKGKKKTIMLLAKQSCCYSDGSSGCGIKLFDNHQVRTSSGAGVGGSGLAFP